MPNHFHVETPCDDPEHARWQLANLLGGCRRSHVLAGFRWEPVGVPELIEGAQKVSRVARYTVLNPSRAGLVDDPLAWPWTTHRDVVGAIADPWVSASHVASVLGRPLRGFVEWMHGYVSADPSVRVDGTPLPVDAEPQDIPTAPLGDVIAAAAAATRGTTSSVREASVTRDTFLRLAVQAGWRDARVLARVCGMTPRGVQWNLQHGRPVDLASAALCLGDARLRVVDATPKGMCRFLPSRGSEQPMRGGMAR
jgi:hypothetical protein